MLRVGDVIGGRFEVRATPKWALPTGVDRETGGPVLFPEPWSMFVFDVVAMRAQTRAAREMDDPRIARVLSVDPVVLEGPPAEAPRLAHGEIVDAAIELVDVTSQLMRTGIAVNPSFAWIERGARVRLPAPSASMGLHVRPWREASQLVGIGAWLTRRIDAAASFAQPVASELRATLSSLPEDDTAAFLEALAPHASDPERARERARSIAPLPLGPSQAHLDLDRSIEHCERMLREPSTLRHDQTYVPLTLAAAYHHRGCVAWARGAREDAVRDVTRAIELDPHARHLTTAALFAEKLGLDATELHERAVAAIQPALPPASGGYDADSIVLLERGDDPPERADRDAARTLHARGVFFAKQGRTREAIADLEASRTRRPTDAAARALAKVRSAAGP